MILFDFQAFALPDHVHVPILFFTPPHIMRASNQLLPS